MKLSLKVDAPLILADATRSPRRSRISLALSGVLGLALLVRLYAWWQAPRLGFVIDEAEYYQIGSILADGRGWSFFDASQWVRPPIYPLFLAELFRTFGTTLTPVRLIQLALSVGSVGLLYRLALRTFDRRTAFVTGLLAALAWPFAVLSYLLLSETVFLFLLLLSFNCLVEYMARCQPLATPVSTTTGTVNNRNRWWRLAFLVASGFFLGLSALTRGQVLSFVPFIGLWLWFNFGWRQWRRTFITFGLLLAVFAITVVPWVWRNYQAYGRPLIDTTGGYNFYLGALHGKDEAVVNNTLAEVANQAQREQLGYQKGLEILFNNPLDFIGKGFKESLDFWGINFGAEERLEQSYTKGTISPAWLLPDQFLGDLLYIVTGALSLLGLLVVANTRNGLRSLVAIWLVYNMALAFVFFAVSRFRLPVYYFLLIFAAYVIAHPREVWQWLHGPVQFAKHSFQRGRWAALGLPLVFLLIVLPTWAPDQTFLGVAEWGLAQNDHQGDQLRLAGQYDAALAAYAKANPTNPATTIGIGLTLAMQGKYTEAQTEIESIKQDYSLAHLSLGWIYLRQGQDDYAHGEFRTRSLALDPNADKWAWDNLPVAPLPNNLLTLGEFDWGYVEGFHNYEKEDANSPYFRWTSDQGETGQDRAKLRFPLAAANTSPLHSVSLYLNGYRPAGLTPPSVEVFANGRSLGRIQTTTSWQTYNLPLPADLNPGSEIIIELAPSSTFIPGATSRRELGVMVQWAQLK